MNDQAEEVSVEELFRELCVRGRDYVTVKDIKKWDYLQELMKVSEVKCSDIYALLCTLARIILIIMKVK